MLGEPGDQRSAVATNRVFRVTLTDRQGDGTRKAFIMLAPASTSQEAALDSAKGRFGARRVVSVE